MVYSYSRFEEFYKNEEHVWGTEALPIVVDSLPYLLPGRVLDLGAGDGRNALYLAHRGFHVTAVDFSPAGLERLAAFASRLGVSDRVVAVNADLAEFSTNERFENVVCTMTLHFLKDDSFNRIVDLAMSATLPGGAHVIQDFTQNGPLYKQDTGYHWATGEELKGLYERAGWEVPIYRLEMIQSRATDENGNRYVQEAVMLVARKPAV